MQNIIYLKDLQSLFNYLLKNIGKQYWWPGDSDFEVSLGAILTQNTTWKNVQKAIDNLKLHKIDSFEKILSLRQDDLAKIIKSSGYYNQKAKRLHIFSRFMMDEFDGFFKTNLKIDQLRKRLLSLHGIGKETADAIVLYAFKKPIFVVDAYTKRIFSRHKILDSSIDYDGIAKKIVENLKNDLYIYNEFHALIVYIGKNYCSPKTPKCNNCPINKFRIHDDKI